MDIVRLRTMTWKSKFTEGKYKGYTVEQVFNEFGRYKIAHYYYRHHKITFTDEILDAIPIFPEQRIEKPGTNGALFDKIMKRVIVRLNGDKALLAEYQREKRRAKRKLAELEEKLNYSKGQLQHFNHHGFYN